jgi:hypothetical protein
MTATLDGVSDNGSVVREAVTLISVLTTAGCRRMKSTTAELPASIFLRVSANPAAVMISSAGSPVADEKVNVP